jgi:mono/diheme cytochrome c family protein
LATSRIRTARRLAALALVAVLTPGCTRIDNALAAVPIFAFLRDAPSFRPYEHPLPAPPGSVPFESPYGGDLLQPLEATEAALNAFAASPDGRNPLAANDTAALRVGQLMYERHCQVCHGPQGLGDGPIIAPNKFAFPPPSFSAEPALSRSDGYIYGVIRAGRGLMPAYGARMSRLERWAVVNYVNALQATSGAAPATQPAVQPAEPGAAQPAPAADTVAADTAAAQQ